MFTIRRGRAPLHISLPDFDKGARCPGWSGEGMRSNKVDWCNDELAPGQSRWALTVRPNATPRAGIECAHELPGFYSWRMRRTNCCNTIVLPQFLYYFTPGAWVRWESAYELPEGRVPGRVRAGSAWNTLYWQLRFLRGRLRPS